MSHLFYRLSFMNMRITSIKLQPCSGQSKLGEVDECIFASCLMLLFCIVVVGSWYFTAFTLTFYVCFHQDLDR